MKRKQPERSEQRQIVALLRHLGATVYVLGTTRKRGDHPGSMQSPGLPDLLVFTPAVWSVASPIVAGQLLVVEVKAPGGRASAAQDAFADHCADAHVAYVRGGLQQVVGWALAQGLLEGTVAGWRIPRHRLMA